MHVCLFDYSCNVLSFSEFLLFISNTCSFNVHALHIAASLASSESEPVPESDVTPAGDKTLDFDDDTSKSENSCYYRSRSRFKTGKPFCFTLRSFYV